MVGVGVSLGAGIETKGFGLTGTAETEKIGAKIKGRTGLAR